MIGHAGGDLVGDDAQAGNLSRVEFCEFAGGVGESEMRSFASFERDDGPTRFVQFAGLPGLR